MSLLPIKTLNFNEPLTYKPFLAQPKKFIQGFTYFSSGALASSAPTEKLGKNL